MRGKVVFFLEPRDFITHVTLVQQNRERDWCVNHWFYSTNSAEFRHSAWKIQTWRTMSCRYIWSEPRILLIYCSQLYSVWSLLLFSEMHICRKFQWTYEQLKSVDIDLQPFHPNFLQNIFLCCWNDLLPFYHHYSFFHHHYLHSILVSGFSLSANIVVL